uniref:BOD1/SHG1 domain-containing protein n=1 Tax=Lotus japonicus TaxID=34305 RepID=I3T486_LOTJA|nr:unknown [Lotus japonicus]
MASNGEVIGKEEVIAKLKDDGDFDKLRLKIIRKLKDNEELRQHITSIVKQSVALNRDGAENMKPRQLSDSIYEEVGEKVMSQISDSLWQIIRSNDGMKGEIAETVQSVCDKLANPKGKDEVLLSTSDGVPVQRQGESASATEVDDTLHENEPEEPPGFTLLHSHLNNNNHEKQDKGHEEQDKGKAQVQRQGSPAEQKEDSQPSQDTHGRG